MNKKLWLLITALASTFLVILVAMPLQAEENQGIPGPQKRTDTPAADNPAPPATPVKLIFIHHSTGGNWLADPNEEQSYGGLGRALMENNYFVSATNYGWGPDQIGSNTDIGYWWDWFRGANASTYMAALYNENGQNICNPTADPPYECFGVWSRLPVTPTGENEIVMFKGCFPNAHMSGNPSDPPTAGENSLRGESAWVWDEGLGTEIPNPNHTVANAKGIYNDILQYFATRQDKLFVVIAGPPLASDDMGFPTDAAHAANYRAFNEWLVNDWLDSYPYQNVAVFDYYNVLTSNGGDPETNDAGTEGGNHHRWWNGAVQHVHPVANDLSAYSMWQDSHPTIAGQQKATAEFVQILNVAYNRWRGGTACVGLTGVAITGPATGYTGTTYTFHATVAPVSATLPITYTWTPAPASGQGTAAAQYSWAVTGTQTVSVTAEGCEGSSTGDTHDITIAPRPATSHRLYLPLVLRQYSVVPVCAIPITGVTITGSASGYTGTQYTFNATPLPSNATTPIAYTWTPAPQSGQGTASVTYQWNGVGSQTIAVSASHCNGAHTAGDDHTINIQAVPAGALVQPGDLTYLGAFRLPDAGERPLTFEYGGNAMTFNPNGHITNSDAFSGSLFVMGHDRLPDELPDGNQVAEISIPAPVNSSNLEDLPYAEFLQGFSNVAAGHFTSLEEIPRAGMVYLDHPDTGAKIHLGWGQHMPPESLPPTHGWFDPDLAAPDFQGEWYIGTQDFNSVNGYMFEIPATWAGAHTAGRYLATGRYRDGGWGGMGPSLFAYTPWLAGGAAPVSGTHLAETVLLRYESSENTPNIEHALANYQHPDEWEGGAWLTTASGKSAVLFAGTKATGAKYWYGWVNPAGPEIPCVEVELVEQFTTCRYANGDPCPESDLTGCTGHNDYRGWWSASFDAQIILYNPADLAQVAAGTLEPWDPQPYATIDIDDRLYFNPPESEQDMIGAGVQRRMRIGDVAYDRENGVLYVIELFADEAKPVVHVWQVQ
ncbi:MAG: hypothetical protein JXA21_01940 [Anaerolineae bacterium]|nr:hypothetical protein [Anaerolineae bacterium]